MSNQTKEKKQIDMLNDGLLKNIFLFAIPLAVSSILQQLFNSVDVAVVGKFATSQDQAAVGCTGPVINLLINLFVGISVGANVVIANYLGQKQNKKVKDAVHTSILIAAISGLFLFILGFFIAKPVLIWMDTPKDTLNLGILYLKIYFTGMPFIMIYNFGAAILRSIGDTKRPLYCLIVSGVLNALLNLLLVIVFHLGVAGVAIATVVSNIVSACMILYLLIKEEGPIHLSLSSLAITRPELVKILKVGIPAGLQGMVFSVANVFIQMALNGFGSNAVAGSAVTMNYEYITYFVINAFNQTAVTFVSQNFGAGKHKRCKKIFWLCMLCSVCITGTMSLIIVLNSNFFASLFSSDADVIQYAVTRMKIILTVNFIASSYEIGGATLRGLGFSMTPAILTIFGTCALRLIWIYTVFERTQSYDMLLVVYPISWVITGVAVLMAYFYISRRILKT